MKNLLTILILLAGICGCQRPPSDDPLAVGPYPRDLCSLIVRSQAAPMIERREVCCSLHRELERRLADDTSAHTRAVFMYVEDAMGLTYRYDRHRWQLLDSASQLVDSVNYPVMMHRIRAELLKLKPHVTKDNYLAILREIEYFGSIGDTLSMALLEVSLGPFFSDAGRKEEALEVTRKVMATFRRIGEPRFESRTRLNEATYYAALGDSARWDSVNRILLDDDEIRRNSPRFREGLVRNAYLTVKDTAYLNEGWRIVRSDSSFIRSSTVYYSFFASRALDESDADSALRLLREGWRVGEEFGFPDIHYRLLMMETTARAFEMKGKIDSALRYFTRMVYMSDSVRALDHVEEMMRAKYAREMDIMKYEQELRRDRERWIWSVVVMAVIIVAMVGLIWVWKQRQSTLLRLAREQGEMERTRRQLAASILAKQEKDNLLTEMNRHIDRMSSEGQLNGAAVSDLQMMIRLHATGQKEWEAFENLLVKIRPRFMARLHEIAPEMTMKYCRLAAYIYVGMSSQQIARLLMIRPMSVYQARWRLRKQLGVPEGEGIEEFLEQLGRD